MLSSEKNGRISQANCSASSCERIRFQQSTDFNCVVMVYLESAERHLEELAERLHQSHIGPFQAPEMNQKSFYTILDQD